MKPIDPIAPGLDHLPITDGPLTPMTKREEWWQEQLEKAQACCAFKDEALKRIGTGWKYPLEHFDKIINDALSSTCGTELLAELQKYRDILNGKQHHPPYTFETAMAELQRYREKYGEIEKQSREYANLIKKYGAL